METPDNLNTDIYVETTNKENINDYRMITNTSLIKPIAVSVSESHKSILEAICSAEPSEGMIPLHDKSLYEIGEHIAAFCGNTVWNYGLIRWKSLRDNAEPSPHGKV